MSNRTVLIQVILFTQYAYINVVQSTDTSAECIQFCVAATGLSINLFNAGFLLESNKEIERMDSSEKTVLSFCHVSVPE